MVVYLDSCVVIYLIQARELWCSRIRSRLLPSGAPMPGVCYSDLTRMECRVGSKLRGDVEALSEYDGFFVTPRFRRIALHSSVFDLVTDLRARHRIEVADALRWRRRSTPAAKSSGPTTFRCRKRLRFVRRS